MNYTTTRRYSRTLADAFPSERAHCIEGPAPKNYRRSAGNWALVAVIWILLTLIAMGY